MLSFIVFLTTVLFAADKKVLIVYLSQTGETEKTANQLKESLSKVTENGIESTLVSLDCHTEDETAFKKIALYAKSAFRAATAVCTKPTENPSDYDAVIVGGPVWWWTMPKQEQNVLGEMDFSAVKDHVFTFATAGGKTPGSFHNAFTTATGITPSGTFLARNGVDVTDEIAQFAKKIGQNLGVVAADPVPEPEPVVEQESVPEPPVVENKEEI
ncbi:hypothetical protein BLNAU_10121 [Blattamonas nauphoetae]|uniref:Flavodoxin-like domain-containing protein n=1 Tax=Blattamonas nauphoetae TaxID=2049346 RepID=A0ABQ9XU28_9EUKA|nr:hypothetical protein BLNAU_10121 [Blattamonas nauphoetae]